MRDRLIFRESDIIGYEGLYSVTSDGKVFNKKYKKYINGYVQKRRLLKYKVVLLYKNKKAKAFYVHRLVGLHFIENKENKPYINHVDNDGLNNGVDNLEWCTQDENIKHSALQGRQTRGVDIWNVKLDNSSVALVREISHKKLWTQAELSRIFKVSKMCICKIVNNKTWKHVKDKNIWQK